MSTDINFRNAKAGDAESMVKIHFKAVQAISNCCYDKQTLMAWSPKPSTQRFQWLAAFVANVNVKSYVATNNKNKVLGFVTYLIDDKCLKAMYVDPKQSGLGIGSGLLKMVEAFASQQSVDKINLKASINAVKFY